MTSTYAVCSHFGVPVRFERSCWSLTYGMQALFLSYFDTTEFLALGHLKISNVFSVNLLINFAFSWIWEFPF